MTPITDIARLEEIYGAPAPASLTKVAYEITPLYARWIETARFAVLCTVGPEGTDASPRGDDGPVVRIADLSTLIMPDWRGNNRIDSLRNILRDPRAALMFMVPGCQNVVRVNGRAILTEDAALLESFGQRSRQPRTAIVLTVGEVYFQCAKAIMRSGLWSGATPEVPSAGDFIRERDAAFDGRAYDAGYPEYAKTKMW